MVVAASGRTGDEPTRRVLAALAHLCSLLSDHVPPVHDMWTQMFDLGLARVDFPVGLGGSDAPRSLRRQIDLAMRGFGVPSVHAANIAGVSVVASALVAFGGIAQ